DERRAGVAQLAQAGQLPAGRLAQRLDRCVPKRRAAYVRVVVVDPDPAGTSGVRRLRDRSGQVHVLDVGAKVHEGPGYDGGADPADQLGIAVQTFVVVRLDGFVGHAWDATRTSLGAVRLRRPGTADRSTWRARAAGRPCR